MIDAIAAINAQPAAVLAESGPLQLAASSAPRIDFGALIAQGVESVDSNVGAAEASLQKLASGQPIELHEVMITLEQARIGVQTLIQVRNKVVEAYQELMRMQI